MKSLVEVRALSYKVKSNESWGYLSWNCPSCEARNKSSMKGSTLVQRVPRGVLVGPHAKEERGIEVRCNKCELRVTVFGPLGRQGGLVKA